MAPIWPVMVFVIRMFILFGVFEKFPVRSLGTPQTIVLLFIGVFMWVCFFPHQKRCVNIYDIIRNSFINKSSFCSSCSPWEPPKKRGPYAPATIAATTTTPRPTVPIAPKLTTTTPLVQHQ